MGLTIASTITAAMPALIANMALELAPVRVNLVAPGFVDTRLSDSLLGEDLENAANKCATRYLSGVLFGPADVAALAVHIMASTALSGATYEVDGGQQLIASR